MRSHRLQPRAAQAGRRAVRGFDWRFCHPDCGAGRTPAADARGAAGGCVAWRARRVLVPDPRMPKSLAPGPVPAASGPRAPTGARPPPQTPSPTTLRRSRTTAPPHRSPSPTAPRSTPSSSTPRHRPIRSPFRTGPPSRSPIRHRPVPRFCPPSRSTPAPHWRSAKALLPKSRRLPVAATSLSVPPIPPPLLIHLGKQQHHVLRQTVGRGHARDRRRRSADADRPGKHDRRCLDLCNCDANGGLTINGGSLNVTDPGLGTVVEGGTLSVINGGTLQTPQPGCRLLIRDGHRRAPARP